MLHGKILAGEENVSPDDRERRWYKDSFPELHNDDALWAYMIRVSEELDLNDFLTSDRINDKVLRRLLKMGVWDWTGDHQVLNQTVPAMRHSTAMVSRVLVRLLNLEKKVDLVPVVMKTTLTKS